MKRWLALPALAAVAGCGGPAPAPSTVQTATTQIVRQDLVETETVDGTLRYADERTVAPKLKGTVTWAPAEGAVIEPDHRLTEIDGKGVYLMEGDVPAYRPLGPGVSGTDVRQLQRALDVEGDGTWDPATTEAVEGWQEAKGLPVTGTIDLGRVVFLPGVRRIVSTGRVGGPAAPVVTSATDRVVTVALDTAQADLARGAVAVELPSGRTVDGKVDTVGRVASKQGTVEVTIAVEATGIDRAPVEVELERGRAEDVLAIPVTALLARTGGGFAVELRDHGRRVVPVEVGRFASGFVEIEGDGLKAGLPVTNAAL
jgi:hypothetical protein